jgi:hypothetical protein
VRRLQAVPLLDTLLLRLQHELAACCHSINECNVSVLHAVCICYLSCALLLQSQFRRQRTSEFYGERRLHLHVLPILLSAALVLVACGYAFTRVAYGMEGFGLGLKVYSYVVLVVELVAVLAVLARGARLAARPVNRDVARALRASEARSCLPPWPVLRCPARSARGTAEHHPCTPAPRSATAAVRMQGQPQCLRRDYTVRVLVPCGAQSLAAAQRTVLAAKLAGRPPGAALRIYVCDGGRDARKCAWVLHLDDPEILYVAHPTEADTDVGGKKQSAQGEGDLAPPKLPSAAAVLNHVLRLIYPDVEDRERPGQLRRVPLQELACVFLPGQMCSRAFFDIMLRYVDSGDEVAAALAPPLLHNVVPDCDVLNHQDVHFWERAQPGMDALGVVSLAGADALLRSRALGQAGWFPAGAADGEWALGMRFKRLGYRCHYVDVRLLQSCLKRAACDMLLRCACRT